MQLEVGTVIEGKVTGITKYGVFVLLPNGKTGMVHISEISTDFVRDIQDYVQKDQMIKAQVIGITEKNGVALSMKSLLADKPVFASNRPTSKKNLNNKLNNSNNKARPSGKKTFEEMLSSFKHTSEEKISDLKRTRDIRRSSSSRRGSH